MGVWYPAWILTYRQDELRKIHEGVAQLDLLLFLFFFSYLVDQNCLGLIIECYRLFNQQRHGSLQLKSFLLAEVEIVRGSTSPETTLTITIADHQRRIERQRGGSFFEEKGRLTFSDQLIVRIPNRDNEILGLVPNLIRQLIILNLANLVEYIALNLYYFYFEKLVLLLVFLWLSLHQLEVGAAWIRDIKYFALMKTFALNGIATQLIILHLR